MSLGTASCGGACLTRWGNNIIACGAAGGGIQSSVVSAAKSCAVDEACSQGVQSLKRRGSKRTVALNTTQAAPDRGQVTLCLSVVQDGDVSAARTGIDGRLHAAWELL